MKIFSPTARQVQYNGTHGNLSVAVLSANLASAQIGDEIVLGEFDALPEVVGFRVNHDNLGAGTSLDLGFDYPGDAEAQSNVLADGLDTTSAGQKEMSKEPVTADKDFCQLQATVKGAVASGKVTVTLFYRNRN